MWVMNLEPKGIRGVVTTTGLSEKKEIIIILCFLWQYHPLDFEITFLKSNQLEAFIFRIF